MSARILVVDDEPAIRRLLRNTLERAGYEIVEARNGREAIAMAAAERPSAILLDLGLPDRDGLGLIPLLRRDGDTTILVVSAREATDEKVAALDLGADDFVTKPFDHLLFTGATSVAKHIMRAAAENLVPVTLELGGKSPAIVGRDADLELAARRLLFGKTLNAGQVCVSPDYALVPRKHVDAFVDALSRSVASMFPTLRDNPDYTSIVNERHHGRLLGYLDDARAKGATLRVLGKGDERFDDRRIAPTVVLGADDSMDIMRDEIFGPLLPILPYDDIDGAVDYINAHARPLALYYFGNDTGEQERVLAKTVAGGVTINDTVMHLAMDDLPFGGIGPSGMGAYHGHDGFLTFSHARSVYRQARFDVTAMLRPPYGTTIKRLLSLKIRR